MQSTSSILNIAKDSQRHSYHLVDPSPWPLVGAFSALMLTSGTALFAHFYNTGFSLLSFGFLMILFTMFGWWKDIIREGTFEGQHTNFVQVGLRLGMLLFIVSEVMFFFAFFWGFFHSSFNPNLAIGGIWPPVFLATLSAWQVPLLNTCLLLTSGASVTWAHHAIVNGSKSETIFAMIITVTLAIIFTALQGFEYVTAGFTISDSVYGSAFYMATGFHGFHVLIGTIFLFICTIRIMFNHLTTGHHFGFEAAAWYWHFVDVVWLFLFVSIYWWGS